MNTDIFLFFNTRPDALPLYRALEAGILESIPDVKIKVSKTQIGFSNRRGFACASFLPVRKAALRPPVWLTVTFGLGYQKRSPRIDAAAEPYPGRWTHHVTLSRPEDVDEELLGWLAEAAAFSANKR